MKYKLFGKEININDHHCNFNDHVGEKIKVPYVNLYVRITDYCQANCPFCTFHGAPNTFNGYKFLYTLMRLRKQIKINKVSFTGGEPTVMMPMINLLLKEVKEMDKDIFTIVNTNGYRLNDLDTDYIDSIALSRHHYSDTANDRLFGNVTSIPSLKTLEKFKHKEKVHLSCNLIKGEIDSVDECYNFISLMGKRGFTDIGFVSLMPNNQWSKDHFVDFSAINLNWMKDTFNSTNWSKGTACKCSNFLTSLDDGTIVKSYARYYADREECEGMLVYDADEKLKNGFCGEVIYE